MKPYSLIVAGSRGLNVSDEVLDFMLTHVLGLPGSEVTVISGTAKGPDSDAIRWATARGYDLEKVPAEWYKYGKRAGRIRNANMATLALTAPKASHLVAYWDGKSTGTADMVATARLLGLTEVYVPSYVEGHWYYR